MPNEKSKSQEKNKPAHEIRLGRIKATIWHNLTEGGSSRHNVQIRRIYKDGENWDTSDAFGRDDLWVVAEVAREAALWIYQRSKNEG